MLARCQQIPVCHWSSPGFVRLSHKPTATVIGSSRKPLVTSALSKYSLAFSFTQNGDDGGGRVGRGERMGWGPRGSHIYHTLTQLYLNVHSENCARAEKFNFHSTHTQINAHTSLHVTTSASPSSSLSSASVTGLTRQKPTPGSGTLSKWKAVFLFTLRHGMKF